ncbi:MAG TPA: SpoIIE family protein phosphatase [Burkholderiales bacterium]|nr:SpoIIE family protein phosphatase [Burkholderiales bacterium]
MPETSRRLALTGELAAVERAADWIRAFGAEFAIEAEDVRRLELCTTELLGNIVRHAYDGPGEHRIELRARVNERTAALEIADDGRAFDPIAWRPPGPAPADDAARAGGSGLRLVQQFADECRYARRGKKNVVTLVLKRQAAAHAGHAPRGPERRRREGPAAVPLWRRDGTLVLADERHGLDRRIRGFISQFDVFRGVPYHLVEEAIAACRIVRYTDGQVLLRPGERGDALVFVLSGRLRVHLDAPDSANFFTIGAGEFTGELSVIDGKPVSAYVVADSGCRALLVDAETLFRRLLTVPEVSRNFMTAYSERARGTSVHIIEQLRAEMAHREAQSAQRVQAALLQPESPLLPQRVEVDCAATLRTAREVSGDFYDAFFLDPTRLFVTVGDVSGKGLPTALCMVRVLSILRREAASATLPQAVGHLNRLLFAANDAGLSVSLFCAVLDTATGTLAYVSAGHPPPALARGDALFRPLDTARNPVVGVVENAVYSGGEIGLPPGSALVLRTDGVAEAQAWSREAFGDARLLEALNHADDRSAATLIEDTIAALDRFVGDAPQSDDITLLALRYRGPASA